MRFPVSFLDEIRARLPVSDVVSRRVKLKRQGREFIGLSPFKQEKTPSFTVNDSKGFYHCFASGEHGDIFTFLMKTEGLAFQEAVERLAQDAGLPVPKASPELEKRERVNDRLRALMEAAAVWFQEALGARSGRAARAYLESRGVSEADQRRFRIGYAPGERYALKEHLAAKDFSLEEMALAGMVISGEDIAVAYDRFRNRIIFPIGDLRDRVIAFGGRALDPDQPAKYLNSPETPLFHKGSVLFNAAHARKSAHDRGTLLVAEGYMDVVALVGAGFEHAVAPLGTALTSNQLQLIWRMAEEPVLCFDGDEAGQKAASRALDTALPELKPGRSLRFAFLPAGQDPDDVLRQAGSEAFAALIGAAQPLADVLWRREAGRQQLETPERRAALEARIDTLLAQIADQKVRRHYQHELNSRFNQVIAAAAQSRTPGRGWPHRGGPKNRRGTRGYQDRPWERNVPSAASESLKQSPLVRGPALSLGVRESLILLTLLSHPWLLEAYSEEIADLHLSAPPLDELRKAIIGVHIERETLDSEQLRTQLNDMGFGAIVARVESAITHKSDWFAEPDASPQEVETGWRQVLALHRKALDLEQELVAAERAFQDDVTDENAYERLVDIRRQLSDAEGTEVSNEDLEASASQPSRAAS